MEGFQVALATLNLQNQARIAELAAASEGLLNEMVADWKQMGPDFDIGGFNRFIRTILTLRKESTNLTSKTIGDIEKALKTKKKGQDA
jgi:hypothetical protein